MWEFVGNIYDSRPQRVGGRYWTGSCGRWTRGRLRCKEKEVVLSKGIVVESETKVWPILLRAWPSQVLICVQNHIHLPPILPSILPNPHTRSSTFHMAYQRLKPGVRDSYGFEGVKEDRSLGESGAAREGQWYVRICEERQMT